MLRDVTAENVRRQLRNVRTVLRGSAADVEQLSEEVLDEELLSQTVDVHDVAAELLAALLSTVERRRFVDDRVPRTSLTATGELGPPRRICNRHGTAR